MNPSEEEILQKGKALLESNDPVVSELKVYAEEFENSNRNVELIKIAPCYQVFKDLIIYHAGKLLADHMKSREVKNLQQLLSAFPSKMTLSSWSNIGGQLIPRQEVTKFVKQVHSDKIKGWDDVHRFYKNQGEQYPLQKLIHALAAAQEILPLKWKKDPGNALKRVLTASVETREMITKRIFKSREKDYKNPFRQMVYDSPEEMNKVVGRLEDNSFIQQEKQALQQYKKLVKSILNDFVPE